MELTRPLALPAGRSVGVMLLRRGMLAVAGTMMCCGLISIFIGDSRGGVSLQEANSGAKGAEAAHDSNSIINDARSKAEHIISSSSLSDVGKEDAELVPYLSDKDLLAIAVKSQLQDNMQRHTRSPDGEEDTAAIDEDHGHISKGLLKLAKEARELQGADHPSRHGTDKNKGVDRESRAAKDLDGGKLPPEVLKLAVKAAKEMKQEGDVAGSGSLSYQKDGKSVRSEAEDHDNGVVKSGLIRLAQQAANEQGRHSRRIIASHSSVVMGARNGAEEHKARRGNSALDVLREAEREQAEDSKLAQASHRIENVFQDDDQR